MCSSVKLPKVFPSGGSYSPGVRYRTLSGGGFDFVIVQLDTTLFLNILHISSFRLLCITIIWKSACFCFFLKKSIHVACKKTTLTSCRIILSCLSIMPYLVNFQDLVIQLNSLFKLDAHPVPKVSALIVVMITFCQLFVNCTLITKRE